MYYTVDATNNSPTPQLLHSPPHTHILIRSNRIRSLSLSLLSWPREAMTSRAIYPAPPLPAPLARSREERKRSRPLFQPLAAGAAAAGCNTYSTPCCSGQGQASRYIEVRDGFSDDDDDWAAGEVGEFRACDWGEVSLEDIMFSR